MSSNKSEYLTTLGDRLAKERSRCGHTQKSIADNLDITARTQIKYEIGETAPDAYYLHGLDAIGIDVTYVLTGVRGATPSPEESQLIACYRSVDKATRSALTQLLAGMADMVRASRKKRDFFAVPEEVRVRPGRQRKLPVGRPRKQKDVLNEVPTKEGEGSEGAETNASGENVRD